MGLRAKFNIMLLIVALVGVSLFFAVATPILAGMAREEVVQSSRIMMESAAGARKYTSEQIAPLLSADMRTTFHPQAVSAYAAKKNFDVLHAKFSDYTYREAALNPTNPEDRAVDWEADLINDFRAHPEKQEIVVARATAMGPVLNMARPLVSKPACLACHSTPEAAPVSMVALYGAQNGFGWRPNEIIGAQIVTVPLAVPSARAAKARNVFLAAYAAIFVLLLCLMNLLLGAVVIAPIDRIARNAEAISMGATGVAEYEPKGSDQIARLARSFNRMRRSLEEALRMLD